MGTRRDYSQLFSEESGAGLTSRGGLQTKRFMLFIQIACYRKESLGMDSNFSKSQADFGPLSRTSYGCNQYPSRLFVQGRLKLSSHQPTQNADVVKPTVRYC